MRRRSSGPAVALFPFLAVLLCAMGALILLLLVLARQVREETLQTETPAEERPAAPVVSQPSKTIPIVTVVVPPPPMPPTADPNVALRDRLAELTETKAEAARNVEQVRQAVDRQTGEVRSLEASIAAAAFDVDATSQRLKARSQTVRQREARQRDLQAAIARSQGTLKAASHAAATAEPKVSIVPYDGIHGTARRPILVECTDSAIRFLPEGVELTASDLDGFQANYNPLLAGVVALRKHWMAVDGSSSPRPYVLLLVRENGVAAYYTARAMLRPLDEETGYELITDDLSLQLPDVDPKARDACHRAVRDVLQNGPVNDDLLVGGGSLFPTGRFEVDPGDHDPTQVEPVPFGRRTPPRRRTASLPPAGPPGGRERSGDDRADRGSLPGQRPLPTSGTALEPVSEPVGFGPSVAAAAPSAADTSDAGSRFGSSRRAGSRFAGSGGSSEGEASSREREAASDMLPMYGIAGAKRRWGLSAPTSNIALERPVALLVTGDEIVVGVQPPIPVDKGVTPETIRAVFAAIDREAVAWGRAPGQFYWSPRLTATVRPGGTGNLDHLQHALARSGLRMSSEIVLSPGTPAFLELNHGETAP